MKKTLLVFGLCCCMILCAACATGSAPPPEEETYQYDMPVRDGHYIFEDHERGLTFGIPIKHLENKTIYYGQFALGDTPTDTPPLDAMQIFFFPPELLQSLAEKLQNDSSEEALEEVSLTIYERSRLLYSIYYYSAGLWDAWMGEGKTIAEITGNEINEELGRQNGRVYVYTEAPPDEQGLEGIELAAYRDALAALSGMRALAAMLESAPAESEPMQNANIFPQFLAQDIYGADIDSSIFAGYDLTMLNVWGTFCAPCIEEMPYLGEMAAAMPQGTQMVGLVGDALNAENIALAQTIAEQTGAAYPHIVPDKAIYDYMRFFIFAYPTTLFIDAEGNIVGEPVIGARSRAQYEEELNSRLEQLPSKSTTGEAEPEAVL